MPNFQVDEKILLKPAVDASFFTPTEFSSAEEKAKFFNKLMRFIASDFQQSLFTKFVYNHTHIHMGFIAHYSIHGFWEEYFLNTSGKITFLENLAGDHVCVYGNPHYTFCDVHRMVIERLQTAEIINLYKQRLAFETLQTKRALYESLRREFEGDQASDQPVSLAAGIELRPEHNAVHAAPRPAPDLNLNKHKPKGAQSKNTGSPIQTAFVQASLFADFDQHP